MHSWHIALQDLFQSFELYSSKNIVKCPFSQVLDTKGFQKESISKMLLHCFGAILFPPGLVSKHTCKRTMLGQP
jgi:hypothetical protein